ncbi:MAG: hypothetical protein WCA19_02285 [Candidatus Acidiferrales bacterium]
MARKKFTKDQQISGLRKALKNPRTPKQLLPSMKKRLAKLLALVFFVLFVPAASRAQFIGYTSPQTTSFTVANAVTCPASPGVTNTVNVPNLGQTNHFVTYNTTGTASRIVVDILESDGSLTQRISDDGQSIPSGVITANGYYPIIQVSYTCIGNGGTISIQYFGVSSTALPVTGLQDVAAYHKTVTQNNTSGTGQSFGIATPYGNTCGNLYFNNSSSQAGTTLTVSLNEGGSITPTILPSQTMATSGLTIIPMPCFPATFVNVSVTPGGAGNFAIVYDFWKSGTAVNTTLGTYTHVTTTTATTAKATFGTLVSITVNTPAAGTISVFDLATASCTGTPATNVVAVITATATAPFGTFAYNHAMLNGICVKASVAMDFTVSTQ